MRVVEIVSSIYTCIHQTYPRGLLVEEELNSYVYNTLLNDEVDLYSITQKYNILFKKITEEHSV